MYTVDRKRERRRRKKLPFSPPRQAPGNSPPPPPLPPLLMQQYTDGRGPIPFLYFWTRSLIFAAQKSTYRLGKHSLGNYNSGSWEKKHSKCIGGEEIELISYLVIPFSYKDVLQNDICASVTHTLHVFSAFFCNCGVRIIHLCVGSIANLSWQVQTEREKESFVSR